MNGKNISTLVCFAQDKDNCACWQMTIEGTNLGKDSINLEVGYQYRRLMDHVISGIYECNSRQGLKLYDKHKKQKSSNEQCLIIVAQPFLLNRCKCRNTCLNRVVQNDMKWQLQIFKTSNKGWAIRPLHDIPPGSFICVYAGQLLTEHGANSVSLKRIINTYIYFAQFEF